MSPNDNLIIDEKAVKTTPGPRNKNEKLNPIKKSNHVDSPELTKNKKTRYESATDEAFTYTIPKPEKAEPAKAVQPVIGDPTIEDHQRDASANANMTTAESGMAVPTTDMNDNPKTEPIAPISGSLTGAVKVEEEAIEVDRSLFDSNFNFSRIENLVFDITNEHSMEDSINARRAMADAFTELFVGALCVKVLYTPNTDNLFFGIRVYPHASAHDLVYRSCRPDEHANDVHSYEIEFDSKLFNPVMSLSEREITSLALYAIFNTIIDNKAMICIRAALRDYSIATNDTTHLSGLSQGAIDLLAFGIKDGLMKYGSPFNKQSALDVARDPFIRAIGYHGDIERALKKIAHHEDYIANDADRRNIILSWVLRIIEDYPHTRLHAYNQIKKCIGLTGSELENRSLRAIANTLTSVSNIDEAVYEASEDDNSDSSTSISITDLRRKVVDLKVDLATEPDLSVMDTILTTAWNAIQNIQHQLDNPYLPEQQRNEWQALLDDFMAIKQLCIDNVDYINRQEKSRIPVEYLSLNENF